MDYLYLGICVLNKQLSVEVVDTERVTQFLEEYFRYAFCKNFAGDCSAYINVIKQPSENFLRIFRMEELIENQGKFCM